VSGLVGVVVGAVESDIRAAEQALFRRYAVAPSEIVTRSLINKVSIQLRVLAFGDGPPVLCLHAASWFAAHWHHCAGYCPVAATIASTCRVTVSVTA
jgi:hypothetical protein